MGSTVIDVEEGIKEGFINYNTEIAPHPKWIPLKYSIIKKQKQTKIKILIKLKVNLILLNFF